MLSKCEPLHSDCSRMWWGDVGEEAGLCSCPVCLCRRGSMLSTAIFVYAATSPVNGYFGGSLYAKQGGISQPIPLLPELFALRLLFLPSHSFSTNKLGYFVLIVCLTSNGRYWFLVTQAEDGLSRCSSGLSWSQPWCVALPSSSTSSPSTTTHPEPSPSAPWRVLFCD